MSKTELPPNHYSFTINTDASRDPNSGIAAWACWIRSSHFLIKRSESFPEPIVNSSVAELLSVEEALRLIDNLIDVQPFLQYYHKRGAIVLYINTDSMWTVHALKGIVKRSKHVKEAERVKSLANGFIIIPRHVKGHTAGENSRRWVNNWCDKQARKLVRRRMRV